MGIPSARPRWKLCREARCAAVRHSRTEFIAHWNDRLLSGAEGLPKAGQVSTAIGHGMKQERQLVAHNPNSVFIIGPGAARAY